VIGRVGVDEGGEAAGRFPVELAAVDNDSADGGSVAADKLGCGVDDDVGAVLDGADQHGGGGGVIDDQREAVLVGDGGELFDVGDVELGVAEGFGVDGSGFGVDGGADAVEVVGVGEAHGDALARQRVVEEVVGSAVERGGGDDLFAGRGEGLDGEGLGGLAGGGCQAGYSTFECGYALLEHVGGGVHQAGVDVAEFLESEEAGGVVRVVEEVGGGLVDGDRAGVGGGVGDLAGVEG